jgi:hypothetical protein
MRITRKQLRQLIQEEAGRLSEQGDDDASSAEISVPVSSSHTIFILLQGLESDANRISELLRGESPEHLAHEGDGLGLNIALRRALDMSERRVAAIRKALGELGLDLTKD